MNKSFIYIVSLVLFASCETVVDIDLEEGQKNLVSRSVLEFPLGDDYGVATVELSETSAFFSDMDNPVVSGAHVVINDIYVLLEQGENSGIYTLDSIPLTENGIYNLSIEASIDGQEGAWKGSDYFTEIPPVDTYISLESGQGPYMKDGYIVNVTFTDPGDEVNFYLLETSRPYTLDSIDGRSNYPNLRPYDDEFVNGNDVNFPIYKLYNIGDCVSIKFSSISEPTFLFYENLYQLLYQTIGIGAAPPFALRGNLVSENENFENAFGNFKVKNVFQKDLVIEE
ncbi:MAG: DUF4249 family protein [Flavobacteriales bacterium]|jgi:hypothetical protein